MNTNKRKFPNKRWVITLGIILAAILALVGGGTAVIGYLGDNPSACGTCHIMQSHVDSYYKSDFLDNLHEKTGQAIKCKDCHQVTLIQQSKEALEFLTHSYSTPIKQTRETQSACIKCHPIMHIADSIRNKPQFVDDPRLSYHITAEKGRVGCYDPRVAITQCQDCHGGHKKSVNYCTCHYVAWGAPEK